MVELGARHGRWWRAGATGAARRAGYNVAAGVVRGKAKLPYTPASEDTVPPPPTALGRLTKEQEEMRRDRASKSMDAHLKAATKWHTEETRLLGAARAEITGRNYGLGNVLSPNYEEEDTPDEMKTADKKNTADKPGGVTRAFKDQVKRGLLGPTPWLRRAE